jgi:hypothetical protein
LAAGACVVRSAMQKPPPSGKRPPAPARFTLDRAGIARLNALEGIEQSEESKRMFEEFDRLGLTFEQRREAIIAFHSKRNVNS